MSHATSSILCCTGACIRVHDMAAGKLIGHLVSQTIRSRYRAFHVQSMLFVKVNELLYLARRPAPHWRHWCRTVVCTIQQAIFLPPIYVFRQKDPAKYATSLSTRVELCTCIVSAMPLELRGLGHVHSFQPSNDWLSSGVEFQVRAWSLTPASGMISASWPPNCVWWYISGTLILLYVVCGQ